MAIDKTRERLTEELAPRLLALGLDLEAVDLSPAGRRRVLKIAVDQDGGVTLDDIAAATKEISSVLDDSDAMGQQPYTLEVTSPGVDRPLTLPRHWRRNIGRLVAVTLTDDSTAAGRIATEDNGEVTLEGETGTVTLQVADVARASVQIEFNRKES